MTTTTTTEALTALRDRYYEAAALDIPSQGNTVLHTVIAEIRRFATDHADEIAADPALKADVHHLVDVVLRETFGSGYRGRKAK